MFKRKDLKLKARSDLKRHYLKAVIVCFLVSFIVGSLALPFVNEYDTSKEIYGSINLHYQGKNNSNIIGDFLNGIGVDLNPVDDIEVSKGVFASLFNNITKSGDFVFGILNALNEGIFHGKILYSVTLFIGMLVYLAYWIFIQCPVLVSECRFFEESVLYKNTSPSTLLFPLRAKRLWNTAKAMLFKNMLHLLWCFTLVGGIIKRYSYCLVPYILAENPDISARDAVNLSKRMMQGKKWQVFLLELSFIPWHLLNICTFNLLYFFWLNAYIKSTNTELYFELRREAIDNKIDGYELLNDRWLTELPENPEYISNGCYPNSLLTVPEREKRQWIRTEYHRNYSLLSLILIFFSFSIGGWIWEVILQIANGQGFVNRGVLHGPWLPIYGCGGVLVLILLKKFIDKPMLTFGLTILICGTVEYFTGWFLETTKGVRWWDYSGYFLQLNGRICAEGLLIFGIGGCTAIYLIAPLLDDLWKKIPRKLAIWLCAVLIAVFSVDAVYTHFYPNTGDGITDNIDKTVGYVTTEHQIL